MKRKSSSLTYCLPFLLLCTLGLGLVHGEDINKIQPTGYVMDLAGVIKPDTKTQLEAMCLELQQKTGSQMAIVTVKSLDGNEAAQYANDLFKHLGVGAKKQDDGVLLLVAPNDRKYWIEVGYGLEPVINDARAGDAGRLLPSYFRAGDYSGGISAAAWQIAKYIADSKGVTLTGQPQIRQARQQNTGSGDLWVWLVLAAILFMILASRGSSGSGRGGGGGSGWWVGPVVASTMGRGGWGGSSGGFGGGGGWGGGGGGFGGFGGGGSGGGGAGGSW
ncbi:MAG: TPM domain-containing protein [Candidatus Acidiferrum sp.]